MCKKIGIYGGTFDPIHMGHLMVAEAARQDCSLEEILFIPSASPPHKKDKYIVNPAYRLEMVQLALEDNPFFKISYVEMERQGINYTVDTLRTLRQDYPRGWELWMIVGGDSFLQIETWKDVPEIMRMCHLAVYRRSSYSQDEYDLRADNLQEKYNTKIVFLDAPRVDISSTDIRNRIKEGKSIRYMVPSRVENYIKNNRIYS